MRYAAFTPRVAEAILQGPAVGETDGYCCANHFGRVQYAWDGARFVAVDVEEALSTQPVLHEGMSDGNFIGILRGIGDREILVDVVEWFQGQEAAAACAQDGGPEEVSGPCGDWYVRNSNDLVRAIRVDGSIEVSYLADGADLETVALPVDRLSELQNHGLVGDDGSSTTYFPPELRREHRLDQPGLHYMRTVRAAPVLRSHQIDRLMQAPPMAGRRHHHHDVDRLYAEQQ